MRVIKAKVRWNVRYTNHPEFMILAADWPANDEFKYVERESVYYAENHGAVDMFSYGGPGDGYGGRVFPITMVDGQKRELKGPFSCRAGWVNHLVMSEYYNSHLKEPKEAFPCADVLMFTDETAYERGWTACIASVTLPHLLRACKLADVELVVVWKGGQSLSPDLSGEQADIVGAGLVKTSIAPWDWWQKLAIGTEFSFVPSLNREKVVKASKETHKDTMAYRR